MTHAGSTGDESDDVSAGAQVSSRDEDAVRRQHDPAVAREGRDELLELLLRGGIIENLRHGRMRRITIDSNDHFGARGAEEGHACKRTRNETAKLIVDHRGYSLVDFERIESVSRKGIVELSSIQLICVKDPVLCRDIRYDVGSKALFPIDRAKKYKIVQIDVKGM